MASVGAKKDSRKVSRKRRRGSNNHESDPTPLTPQGGISEVNLDDVTKSLKELTVGVISPSRSSKVGKLKGKKLEFNDPPGHGGAMPLWTDQETESLVRFLLMYCDGHAWPGRKDFKFWNCAADFIKKEANTMYTRSGKSDVCLLTPIPLNTDLY